MSPSRQLLRDANRKLELLLEIMSQEGMSRAPLAAQHLAVALSAVARVAEWMGAQAVAGSDEDTRPELDAYCQNLHRLRERMPDLHAQLLTERSRLEAERAHVVATAAWARSAGKSS